MDDQKWGILLVNGYDLATFRIFTNEKEKCGNRKLEKLEWPLNWLSAT